MGIFFKDSRDMRDETESIGQISMPLRPLDEARRNPNQREREFYGLYVTDVPEAGAFVDRGTPETSTAGAPIPEFVQLPGPIPDRVERDADRRHVVLAINAPTMAERRALRLAADGVEAPEPSEAQRMKRVSQGATFAERAAIRRARNAAGILDDPLAIQRRALMMRGPGELLEAPENGLSAPRIAPGDTA